MAKKSIGTGGTVKHKETKNGKPRGCEKSPVIGNNGLNLNPGDNTKILTVGMKVANLPDIDIKDVNAVQQRLNEYFSIYAEYDMKPTVVGMAIALNGHSRQWLWSVVNDKQGGGAGYNIALPTAVSDCIKKNYFLMENNWENFMQNGKINPVAGIFLGKNNYGYQDKVEHVLTPNTNVVDEYSADDIKSRYLGDSGENDSEEGL